MPFQPCAPCFSTASTHHRGVADHRTILSDLRYDIVREIYEGGMGIVYEAHQRGACGFVKRVAIKVVRERLAANTEFSENFIGEAKLVADLIHTNIVQTYHLGETSGVCFICMELIRGVNLEQFHDRLLANGKKLPVELAVFIVSRVARGLAYAHAKTGADGNLLGIVHRDVSPKNVMIAFEGDVKLTDFGIAKARGFLTDKEGEEVAGKPEYMSPEQADFQVTDKRSDIFSAGVVLSWLLCGRNVFKGATAEESRQRIVDCVVPDFSGLNPEIEPRLAQLLRKAMAKDPAARFQTADEFLYELEYFIYHKGYGPTNETLGKFIRELFAETLAPKPDASKGGTMKMAKTAAPTAADSTVKTPRKPRGASLLDQIKKKLR